jgi:hypothetical protein
MVPGGVWPTLILRGASQPTPNAPEVPRAIGMCLNIASGHVRRYFDISEVLDIQCRPIFVLISIPRTTYKYGNHMHICA